MQRDAYGQGSGSYNTLTECQPEREKVREELVAGLAAGRSGKLA